jgi:hypothetical protein
LLGLGAGHEYALSDSHDDVTEGGTASEVLRRIPIGQLSGCMLRDDLHASLSRQVEPDEQVRTAPFSPCRNNVLQVTAFLWREQRALLSKSKYLSQTQSSSSRKMGVSRVLSRDAR